MQILRRLLLWLLDRCVLINHLTRQNIALRQQLIVLQRGCKRPRFENRDRLFWILFSRICKNWREHLFIVKPATVIGWKDKGFRYYWRRKCANRRRGRPRISRQVRELVQQMIQANTGWGAPRIHGELLRIGIDIGERTVSRLIKRYRPRRPSQTWKTFIKNHMHSTAAVDFFTVPTITFKILFVLVIISHDRRRVLHYNVTTNPSARWTSHQIVEAFPWDTCPKYLIRDRDCIYGKEFRATVTNMGISEVVTSIKSPWQNGYCERLIGSVRRECLDHMIVFGETHLRKILKDSFHYYNSDRTHLGLNKDSPEERTIENKPADGRVIALPRVGGLHHRYTWKQAA